ncbi:hypothetical protein SODG_004027 [Sodalis praecaptivus]
MALPGHGGIVDQYVELTEPIHNLLDQPHRRCRVPLVRLKRCGPNPAFCSLATTADA